MIYGRDRERAQLRELLDDAIAGHGSLVLISGEAGIGKTTLVNDLIHEAQQRSCLVLSGGCYDLTTTPPYGPWGEVIGGYDPPEGGAPFPSWFANAEAMEQMGSQAQLFDEARRFFADVAAYQPLVIVLEDLHWSDTASLDALRFLSRQLTNVPILIAATYRDDEITRRDHLYTLIPVLVREAGGTRLVLQRWGADQIEGLLDARFDLTPGDSERLRDYLDRRADGNPFFVAELLHSLEFDGVLHRHGDSWTLDELDEVSVPTLVKQVIEARLAKLEEGHHRTALKAASVVGQRIPFDIWVDVAESTVAEIAEVAEAAMGLRLIEQLADGSGFEFTHALVRETLYEELILVHRRELHRIAGEILSESTPDRASEIAHHFVEAADDRAYEWLLNAAGQAERSWAWVIAARLVEQSIGLLTDQHSRRNDKGWLLYRNGLLLMWADPARAIELSDSAIEEARRSGDDFLTTAALALRGGVWCAKGEFRRGIRDLERSTLSGSETAKPWPDIAGYAPKGRGDEVIVIWLATAGRFHEAISRYELLKARRNVPPGGTLGFGKALAGLGRIEEAGTAFETARGYAEVRGNPIELSSSLGNEFVWHSIPYFADHPDRLRQRSTEFTSEFTDISSGLVPLTQAERQTIGVLEPAIFIHGSWDLDALRRYVYQEMTSGSWVADRWRSIIAAIALNRGDVDLARQTVIEVLPEGPATEPGDAFFLAATSAHGTMIALEIETGDADEALKWLHSFDRWLEWSGAVLGLAEALLGWATYYRSLDDRDRARDHAERAYDHASDPRQPLALMAADRFLGQLDVDEGKWDEAERRLKASLALAERCEAPFEQALTMVVMAERAAKAGEVDEARRLIRRVREICEPLGGMPTLERVDEIEAMLPKVRRSNGEHPFGLSDREVEVLRLVARGRTDAEAAGELFISPRTVSQHLRNIYNKLGVNNRAEATRVAVEQGMV